MLRCLLQQARRGRKPRRACRTTSHRKHTYGCQETLEKGKAPFKDHSMLKGCWNHGHKCSSFLWAPTEVRNLPKSYPTLICQSWWSEQPKGTREKSKPKMKKRQRNRDKKSELIWMIIHFMRVTYRFIFMTFKNAWEVCNSSPAKSAEL